MIVRRVSVHSSFHSACVSLSFTKTTKPVNAQSTLHWFHKRFKEFTCVEILDFILDWIHIFDRLVTKLQRSSIMYECVQGAVYIDSTWSFTFQKWHLWRNPGSIEEDRLRIYQQTRCSTRWMWLNLHRFCLHEGIVCVYAWCDRSSQQIEAERRAERFVLNINLLNISSFYYQTQRWRATAEWRSIRACGEKTLQQTVR